MEYQQDYDWQEDSMGEVYYQDLSYLFDEEDAEAPDQEIWNADVLARVANEWEPSEEDDNKAVDEAVDPVLKFVGDVQENRYDPDAPISTATLLEQLDEVSVHRN